MKNAGVWAGIVVMLFAGTIFYQAFSLDYSTALGPGPGFFPRWLSGILIIATLCYIWDSLKNGAISTRDILPAGRPLQDILIMMAGLILFAVTVSYFGFVISGTLLLFLMFMRQYRWYMALCISLGISVILLVTFQSLLGVSLPVNDFGW